jgi:HAD superfamily hydrolase (TIGR01450 family)
VSIEQKSVTLLKDIKHFILDLDGTTYRGSEVFEHTLDFIHTLHDLGIGYTFLTNNSSRSTAEYLEKLRGMGLAVKEEQLFTSSLATINYLKSEHPQVEKLYVLGTAGLKMEFQMAGYEVMGEGIAENPDAVIVGFDTTLTFEKLCRAGYWIKKNILYIATHPDRICPTNQPTLLIDCGAICAALKEATSRAPDKILGKPNQLMIEGIIKRNRIDKSGLAMVGDRLYTDMEMARQTGIMGILALTGETKREDLVDYPNPPDLVVGDLSDLKKLLLQSRL